MVDLPIALKALIQGYEILGQPSSKLDFIDRLAVFNELEETKPDVLVIAAAKIKLGLQSKLYFGNLEAVRDWGIAPEYVESMWRMLQQETSDDFVIATGMGATVREFCEASFSSLGLDYRDFVETERRYIRLIDVDALIGDASKAERVINWKAKPTGKS